MRRGAGVGLEAETLRSGTWTRPSDGAPLAYVHACDAGLTRAASYTLVPDGVQTAYHRCGELGEVASGVRILRDGRRLAVIAAESVGLFDTATWREIARVAHAAEPVDAAGFSPDGTQGRRAREKHGEGVDVAAHRDRPSPSRRSSSSTSIARIRS